MAGADYGARAHIYQGSTATDIDLNGSQCLLLALLQCLVAEDIPSCCLLADVCHQLQQLQSEYLRVWLSGDFVFPHQDIEKAMALLSKLLQTGVLKLPSHVTRIMSSLETKYRIDCALQISPSTEEHQQLSNRLEEAVVNNSAGDIIAIATEGGDVNGLTHSGDSLIHLAARLGNCSSIAALGFLKADLEVMNSDNLTPLEEVVRNNYVDSLKALLSAGARSDKFLLRGDTYLHIAAAGGQNGVLEVLLEEGMDVNKKNHLDETPLFQAVRAGNASGVKMLLEKGADVSILPEGSQGVLEMAVESQNVELFTVLIKVGTNFVTEDNSIIHFVARFGNSRMLNMIKKMRLPEHIKNKEGLTPLHLASNPSFVKTLIRMGLDVNDRTEKGETALHLASAKGTLQLVRTLHKEGADINIQNNGGMSPLMVALRNSKEDIAIFLLHKGADPKVKDKLSRTALHYAAEGNCTRAMATLLEVEARVNVLDSKGNSPGCVAALNNMPAVLQVLLENGADLALRDSNGDGMLHHAARSGHVEAVRWLLDAGAAVDMKSEYQWTALHSALIEGHTAVATLLLDRGADINAGDTDGWTPLMRASEIRSHL
ncbi:putative ankyrin repeat protein RF_0381 [Halyomorpha halys]|uniref:putative ankyrin repeat protein RF_0381 n=1 Tax=Halyomorpha halys TaxID=286706 RepID=UPI0006D51F88